ncbi:MAG TPA: potassium channel family protein [Kiloniellaceae bacterium]|nr:potassium channel family protein [Kiloniellaceae bacterium]
MDAADLPVNAADQRLIDRLKETGRCTWLLAALVLLLLIYPAVDASNEASFMVALLNSVLLITAAFASGQGRRTLIVAFVFALPALALNWLWLVSSDRHVGLALLITMILFYGFSIGHVMAYVLRPGPVSGNKLHGAMSAYIMVGIFWAFIYMLIELFLPGSFLNLGSDPPSTHLSWRQFVFFSFTTLTSTGYGSIVPIEGYAQSATILEQLAGVFFVAVLIARLAGLYQPGAAGQTRRR